MDPGNAIITNVFQLQLSWRYRANGVSISSLLRHCDRDGARNRTRSGETNLVGMIYTMLQSRNIALRLSCPRCIHCHTGLAIEITQVYMKPAKTQHATRLYKMRTTDQERKTLKARQNHHLRLLFAYLSNQHKVLEPSLSQFPHPAHLILPM